MARVEHFGLGSVSNAIEVLEFFTVRLVRIAKIVHAAFVEQVVLIGWTE